MIYIPLQWCSSFLRCYLFHRLLVWRFCIGATLVKKSPFYYIIYCKVGSWGGGEGSWGIPIILQGQYNLLGHSGKTSENLTDQDESDPAAKYLSTKVKTYVLFSLELTRSKHRLGNHVTAPTRWYKRAWDNRHQSLYSPSTLGMQNLWSVQNVVTFRWIQLSCLHLTSWINKACLGEVLKTTSLR